MAAKFKEECDGSNECYWSSEDLQGYFKNIHACPRDLSAYLEITWKCKTSKEPL